MLAYPHASVARWRNECAHQIVADFVKLVDLRASAVRGGQDDELRPFLAQGVG
jgi:hypothetical protein